METSGPRVKLLESASTVGKRVVFASLRIAESNLHRMSELPAEEEIRGMPPEVVGICNNGLSSLDLICDGQCASLYPKSAQVIGSPRGHRAYLAAEGKGDIKMIIDAINATYNLLL